MTIGSDLILGVANAADAAKQREAMAKLQNMNSGKAVAHSAAAEQPKRADAATDPWFTQVNESVAPKAQSVAFVPRATHVAESGSKESEAYIQFEAVLLQNMVEGMMPKDSEALFGSGTAGNMWKSMLAEKIADQISRSGALGIAKQIAAGQEALAAARAGMIAKAGDA